MARIDLRHQAVVYLLRRCGAESIQLRHDDGDPQTNGERVVHVAVAAFPGPNWEAAAGRDETAALLRLAALVLNGKPCLRCGQPGMLLPEFDHGPVVVEGVCYLRWNRSWGRYLPDCERTAMG